MSTEAFPKWVRSADVLSPAVLRPINGKFDVTALSAAAPDLIGAHDVVQSQARRLGAVDLSRLAGPIRRPLSAMELRFNALQGTSATLARAARVGPWLLNGDRPRRLLVAFNNNAEIRATGGIPGALGVLTFDQGRVTFGQQTTATELGIQRRSVSDLVRAERELWPQMPYVPGSTNITPDYPRGASMLKKMWERKYPDRVDGVLSIDPVAMSYVLQNSPPLKVAGVTISSQSLVSTLLNTIYADIADTQRQDDVYAGVATVAFERLASGKIDAQQAYAGIHRSVQERRILLYLTDPSMQDVLGGSAITGRLDFSDGPAPQVGVYFNDATQAKLDYYLRYSTSVESLTCSDQVQRMRVRVRVRSLVPADVESLSASIVGPGRRGPRGTMLTSVYLVAPVKGSIDRVSVDGRSLTEFRTELGGRPISTTTAYLTPGQSLTLSYDIRSGKGQIGDPALRVTPGVADLGLGEIGKSSCG